MGRFILCVSVAGVAAYLLICALESVFLVVLPMDDDWCARFEWVEVDQDIFEEQCVEFKNDLESLKYTHNSNLTTTKDYIMIVGGVLTLAAMLLVLHFVPIWKGEHDRSWSGESVGKAVLATFLAVWVVPMILGWILPPPVEWFPPVFRKIHEDRVAAKLAELREVAKYMR
ncbi:hypothetical protein ACFL6M_04395 [Candidatus Eisenbacteria bacterium]|uniref:Transmembrane protein n=1 Tax=Eiseniibacteriota bacterium TaxID=2212470 RepID=A0ABV6YKH0_UNCEI